MKSTQFYITVALGAICLVLSIAVIALGQSNQRLQMEAQQQQEEINKGGMSQQIGTNILKDMAALSLKDAKIKDVLAKNGFNVTVQASPSPSASSTDSKIKP